MDEYYLLYYDRWERNDEEDAVYPVLTYCVSVGELPANIMELLAVEYGINYRDKSGCWVTFPGFFVDEPFEVSPTGILRRLGFPDMRCGEAFGSFYEVRPALSLTDWLKVACAKAAVSFDAVAENETADGVIAFMRRFIAAADKCREKHPVSSKPPTETTSKVEEQAVAVTTTPPKGNTADEKLRKFLKSSPECASLTSVKLGTLIGENDDTVRKTDTWKALARERREIREKNKLIFRLNNELVSASERSSLEKRLKDLGEGSSVK